MASGRFIAWAAIGLLWVLAVWHSWASRGLFVDGSKLLIDMVRYDWFVTFRGPRFHTEVANQILPVIGIRLGVTDLHLLARLLSFDLFGVPTLFYSLALWRAHRDAVLLAAALAAVAIVFMTTSFFIVGEYNTTYALTVMSAVWLATSDRLRLADGIVLLGVACFFSRSYEVTLFLGPIMAAMTCWRVATAASQSRIASAVYVAAGLLFLGGMFVAVGSLLHPFDPEHLEATYLELGYFWWNLQFDLACAAAAVVVVWALVRSDSLGHLTPFLWASIFLALLGVLTSIWAEKFDHAAAVTNFVVVPLSLLVALTHIHAVVMLVVDGLEHLHHRCVGTAVQRTPQSTDASRDRRKNVGLAAGHNSHRRCTAVLLVIRMQNQQHVQSLHKDRIHLVLFSRHRKHHVQEIGTVRQIVLRVNRRLTNRLLVRVGGNRSHLRQQSHNIHVRMVVLGPRIIRR